MSSMGLGMIIWLFKPKTDQRKTPTGLRVSLEIVNVKESMIEVNTQMLKLIGQK